MARKIVMGTGQLSLFDLLDERRSKIISASPQIWTIEEVCNRYYQFKLSDGCSGSFLDSAKRHLMYFMDWLKEHGFDATEKKLLDLDSAILSDFRQMLADNSKISTATANLYLRRC